MTDNILKIKTHPYLVKCTNRITLNLLLGDSVDVEEEDVCYCCRVTYNNDDAEESEPSVLLIHPEYVINLPIEGAKKYFEISKKSTNKGWEHTQVVIDEFNKKAHSYIIKYK